MLLAAIFGTTAANAQPAQPARAQVYSTPDTTFSISGRTVNLGETLVEIIADVAGNPVNYGALSNVLRKIDSADGSLSLPSGADQSDPGTGAVQNGLPAFGGTVVARGDILRFSRSTENLVITVRVYENAGNLAVAAGETPTVVATVDTAAGEFFLLATNDVWTATTDAVEGTQGYMAATGGGNGGENADGGGTAAVGDNDGNARDLAVIGLGVGVVGFMAAYLSGGDFSLFNFAPDLGYSLIESGYAYNVGGRLNFRKDGWHLYAAAGQANSNGEFGDFRYESGGEYTADLWTAAFSETVQGETADYDFSLSADYHGGIWRLSPTYRLHSRLEKDETETRNSLNLESALRYNRWMIRPSAGFRWESAEEFGDNARFNLSAVRRF